MNGSAGYHQEQNDDVKNGRSIGATLFLALENFVFFTWILLRPFVYLFLFVGIPVLLWFSVTEFNSSRYQSKVFSFVSRYLTYRVKDGPSSLIRFPDYGPYDKRLGYAMMPDMIDRLEKKDYRVVRQAEYSPMHARLVDLGIFPLYREKFEAGLRVTDYHDRLMYDSKFPKRLYRRFSDIPSVVVNTLLLIEDRKLLRVDQPHYNPSVEWGRFGKAVTDLLLSKLFPEHDVHGGSTLATQKEKFRHSSEGITFAPKDKLRQMGSASLRAYMNGPYTFTSRQEVALQYINSVPLAAVRGFGEVNGLGDGLWAYFGADFDEVNRLLTSPAIPETPELLHKQAIALRQMLSLFLAHRRPSFYLGSDSGPLTRQIDRYLPLLYKTGVISDSLFREARKIETPYRRSVPPQEKKSFLETKGSTAIRTSLLSDLGVPQLYELDRLDLSVRATIDYDTQQKVTDYLLRLHDKEFLKEQGLIGHRLIKPSNDPSKIIFSFTLYERGEFGNVLRIQTDSYDQPFNINEGVLIDLGSTSKFRTTVTYLQVIERLYNEYKDKSVLELRNVPNQENMDTLRRWVLSYMRQNRGASITNILEAAMERKYAASPGEQFFTAGGMHTFHNFSGRFNGTAMTPKQALRHSVNLPFIRMMRDIAYYHTFNLYGINGYNLKGLSDATRMKLLRRFTSREGRTFLRRYHKRYASMSSDDLFKKVIERVDNTPARYAAALGYFYPKLSYEDFSKRMTDALGPLEESRLESFYGVYIEQDHSLLSRASISGLHVFELYVIKRFMADPNESLNDMEKQSDQTQGEYYEWLYKAKRAHDTRLRIIIEEDAFREIHKMWKMVGYRNRSLVPSYATALGVSADQPAALAEIMGIIANNGLRLPTRKVSRYHFAKDTPFETELVPGPQEATRVLHPEIARLVKEALRDVVANGTAVRLRNGLGEGDDAHIFAGKTGTGDNRHKIYSPSGALIEDRVVSRTATFVFMIGDHSFGTVVVFVQGEEAGEFNYTSSLAVQIVKGMKDILLPLLDASRERNKLLQVKRELQEYEVLLDDEYHEFTSYLEKAIVSVREEIRKKIEGGSQSAPIIRSIQDVQQYQ